jgi:hypothetical protein
MAQVKRVLKNSGSCWLNLGDTYVEKGLVGVPWRVALAMIDQHIPTRSSYLAVRKSWHKKGITFCAITPMAANRLMYGKSSRKIPASGKDIMPPTRKTCAEFLSWQPVRQMASSWTHSVVQAPPIWSPCNWGVNPWGSIYRKHISLMPAGDVTFSYELTHH